MSAEDPKQEKILSYYGPERVKWILKTEFKWGWGYPFPYFVVTDQKIEIIALKGGKPTPYFSVEFPAVHYIEQTAHCLKLVTDHDEYLFPLAGSSLSQRDAKQLTEFINSKSTAKG